MGVWGVAFGGVELLLGFGVSFRFWVLEFGFWVLVPWGLGVWAFGVLESYFLGLLLRFLGFGGFCGLGVWGVWGLGVLGFGALGSWRVTFRVLGLILGLWVLGVWVLGFWSWLVRDAKA